MSFDTAKYTLRAILTTLPETAVVFDEEAPTEDSPSWATRLRRVINDTELSWHIVCDNDGLVDVSRSVSFLTPSGEVINHTTLVAQVNLNETTAVKFSSLLTKEIIGRESIPMTSRKEAREWRQVGEQDAAYVFATGTDRIFRHPLRSEDWRALDAESRWNVIHHAAELEVGHGLAHHKGMWVAAGIQFDSSDAYYDAFHGVAGELLGRITPVGA